MTASTCAAVAHVAQQRDRRRLRKPLAQFDVDRVERVFAVVEQDQPARHEGGDLAGELGADRAAGAGDQHPAPTDQPRHPLAVEHRLRAAQQIFERDRLERVLRTVLGIVEVALKIGQLGQARQRDGQCLGPVEQPAHLVAGQVLRGDDQLLRALAAAVQALDHGFERIDRAQHRDAIDLAPDPRGGVGEDADHAVDGARVAHHLADEGVGPVLGADQQHRHALVPGAFEHVVEPAVLEQTVGEARRAQQRHQHEPIDQQGRARQRREPGQHEHRRQKDQQGQARRTGDVEQIGQRRIAPDAAIEPGQQEHAGGDQGEAGDVEGCQPRLVADDVGAEAQIQRDDERQRRHRDVVSEGEQGAPVVGKDRHPAPITENAGGAKDRHGARRRMPADRPRLDNDAAAVAAALFRTTHTATTISHELGSHELGAPLPGPSARERRHRRAGLSHRPPCDGHPRHRDHARGHGGGMAAGLSRAARRRISDRLRLLFRRVCGAARGRARRSGRPSPRLAGAARLGPFDRRRVRHARRAAGGSGRRVRPEIRQPLRLHLGVQAGPLCAGAGQPAAGDQPRPTRAALGPPRFRDRPARRRQPRLSARARRRSPSCSARSRWRCGGRS